MTGFSGAGQVGGPVIAAAEGTSIPALTETLADELEVDSGDLDLRTAAFVVLADSPDIHNIGFSAVGGNDGFVLGADWDGAVLTLSVCYFEGISISTIASTEIDDGEVLFVDLDLNSGAIVLAISRADVSAEVQEEDFDDIQSAFMSTAASTWVYPIGLAAVTGRTCSP